MSNRAEHAAIPVLHISVGTAMWLSMHISCQIRIFSDAYDEPPTASDSTTITRSDHKLKRELLFKFLGVGPTPTVSVITEASAFHATLGKGQLYDITPRVVQSDLMLFEFKLNFI